MNVSRRQEDIIEIVKENGPITAKSIADRLRLSRSALRPDLAVLTMTGVLGARPKVGYYYAGEERASEEVVAHTLRALRVEDHLSAPIVATPQTSLYDTIVLMFTEDVGTVLVCEDGYLQGLVSRKDLLRAAVGQTDLNGMPVSMVMTPMSKLVCMYPGDGVVEAAQKMMDYEVDCLPVIEMSDDRLKRAGKVVGRISKTTVTRLFLECAGGKV